MKTKKFISICISLGTLMHSIPWNSCTLARQTSKLQNQGQGNKIGANNTNSFTLTNGVKLLGPPFAAVLLG